nr:MAG TPA: hypothetical protein [Bacteriophage sp.]
MTHIPNYIALTSPKLILSKFSFFNIPLEYVKFYAQHVSSTIESLVGAEGS